MHGVGKGRDQRRGHRPTERKVKVKEANMLEKHEAREAGGREKSDRAEQGFVAAGPAASPQNRRSIVNTGRTGKGERNQLLKNKKPVTTCKKKKILCEDLRLSGRCVRATRQIRLQGRPLLAGSRPTVGGECAVRLKQTISTTNEGGGRRNKEGKAEAGPYLYRRKNHIKETAW